MTVAMIVAAVALAGVLIFLGYYVAVLHPRKNSLDWVTLPEKRPLTFALRRHPMERKDALAALIITVVYAATAFFRLGATTAPQTWVDFAQTERVTVQIAQEPVYAAGIRYYCGIGTGVEHYDGTSAGYQVEISEDGVSWLSLWQEHGDPSDPGRITSYYWADAAGYEPSYALTHTYNQVLKWVDIQVSNPQFVRYVRISGKAGRDIMELGKWCVLGEDGRAVPTQVTVLEGGPETAAVFTVDETVPEAPDWYNSAYFDEIYHARTAREFIERVNIYEWTHPPLGKLIIALGIRVFGATPFGWRFMGTLFGVLMLPILYVFLKNLFGKTAAAACGTVLFACDFMHLTQTRIATIDTYGVFFILLSYFFFYRWLTASGTEDRKGKKGEGYGALALSGVFFGVGVASKWTVAYAGVGLAILYLIHMILRMVRWEREGEGRSMAGWLVKTLLVSVACFVVIPGAVYIASYIPYMAACGRELTLSELWRTVVDNQVGMLRYHQGVDAYHPYSSRWYQWLFDAKPILYFSGDLGNGVKESISSFNNPLVSWTGLGAVILVAVRTVQRRCGKGLLIVVGYLAQLVPWLIIGRVTFAYHYFPSVVFLVLAICYLMNDLMECGRARWKPAVYGLTAGAGALYALFYPALMGLAAPSWYLQSLLRWFPSWPIW